MKRVILDCRGRLANQLLCWSNARYVLGELGLNDRTIVVNYPIPPQCIHLPGAEVVDSFNVEHLPIVTRDMLAKTEEDCLWVWEDVYANFPHHNILEPIIRSIKLADSFVGQLNSTIHSNTVGVHVRFGDYVSVDPSNPPAIKPPFIRGTNEYFLNAMAICKEVMPDARFFVASDGTAQELAFLKYQAVVMGWAGEAVFDLFALSKCRLIIGSASTFSAVAATYGDVPLTVPTMNSEEIRRVVERVK